MCRWARRVAEAVNTHAAARGLGWGGGGAWGCRRAGRVSSTVEVGAPAGETGTVWGPTWEPCGVVTTGGGGMLWPVCCF